MPKRAVPSSCRASALPVLALLPFFLSGNLLSSPPSSSAALAAAPPRFAWQDGSKVHYRSYGDDAAKTAIVFVHGWSCDMTSWRAQLPAFEGKARVILLDLLGHGESDRPDGDYTIERFAGSIDAVLRDAKVERALLVGHSMGTPVAREFLRRFPQKTLGIVALDGALRNPFKDGAQVEKFVAMFSGPDFRQAMNGFLAQTFVPSTPESVKADVRAMTAGAAQRIAVSAMRGQFDPAVWKDDAVPVPLMVLVAKSPHWNADYFAYVRTLNPAAEIHEIPDAGHFVMMEKPEAVNPLLVAFAAKAGALPMRFLRPGRPADVSSPEAIVNAVYHTISGPAGQKRDWERFRSLFADGARLVPTGPRPSGDVGPRVLDPEGYIARTEPVFATTSFHEKEVARRVERFGHIAHVFSTYEARHDPADARPFLRGINSFQLVFDGSRWWVLTVFWEAESEGVKIPKEYLP
jgi:pimeloyl-ACP methyl ester carboxylesterase